RRRAPDAHLGQHARRRDRVLPRGVVVRGLPGRRAAAHHARLQRAGRQRAGRVQPTADRARRDAMTRLLLRRLAFALLVMSVVAAGVLGLYFVAPNSGARTIAGGQAREQTAELVRRRLGLDQPIPVQYVRFLGRLGKGDLGYSFVNSEPVTAVIRRDL